MHLSLERRGSWGAAYPRSAKSEHNVQSAFQLRFRKTIHLYQTGLFCFLPQVLQRSLASGAPTQSDVKADF